RLSRAQCPSPTVTPLNRAQLLHQVQTPRIRHRPPANSDSRSNGLAQSELRRIFCSDEGVLVRFAYDKVATAFAAITDWGADAVIISQTPLFALVREEFAHAALSSRLPMMTWSDTFVS